MITAIVRKSCRWNKHDLLKLQNVGFREEFQLKLPMERVKPSRQDPAVRDDIGSRINRSLWPWQGRCPCGRVRDRKDLEANGGLCERCGDQSNSNNTDAVRETSNGNPG